MSMGVERSIKTTSTRNPYFVVRRGIEGIIKKERDQLGCGTNRAMIFEPPPSVPPKKKKPPKNPKSGK